MSQGLGLKIYHIGGGDFAPRVEYNAKSGRFIVVNKSAAPDGSFVTDKIDVTMTAPQFALDIGSIQIGWIHFPPGAAPDATLVPYGEPMPARPSSRHKAGFQVRVWNGSEPEAREFKSTAGVVVDVIEALWDEIAATPEAARGEIPVVQFAGADPVIAKRGTNYAPNFRLTGGWISRDERVFGPRTVPPPGGSPHNGNGNARQPAPNTPPSLPPQWQAPPPPPPPPAPVRAW